MNLDYDLDPVITPDLVAKIGTLDPTDYAQILAAMETQFGQDDTDELGAGFNQPATPGQAIANAHTLSVNSVYVGVGYCLAVVRGREFEVLPLYPDAETAWEEAFGKHPVTNPERIPRGAAVYWVNGGHGHVALSVGGGLCMTTDYHRPGYVDLARIANLGPWCRGQLVGWAEGLNGVDVWPDPSKPKPKPADLSIERRIVVVRKSLHDARKAGKEHRAETLAAWLERLEARAAKK